VLNAPIDETFVRRVAAGCSSPLARREPKVNPLCTIARVNRSRHTTAFVADDSRQELCQS
jgi:hypothetical protein